MIRYNILRPHQPVSLQTGLSSCVQFTDNIRQEHHFTSAQSVHAGNSTLERLGELGFIPGEPVQLLQRGPGGREPLAVVVGETMFALRWLEAECIEVTPV